MKKLSLLFLLFVATVGGAASQSGRRISTPTPIAPIQPPLTPEPDPPPASPAGLLFLPEKLRERKIRALDNSTFRLEDFQGKVLVINLWASWCGPCRREVPELEKVRKAYAGREVEFIGLTTDETRSAEKVNKFVREVNFGFRIGWADRELARSLMKGRAIPQTLVIDAKGRVVSHWTGYSPGQSGERLTQTIEGALSPP
jgi:thiol-disulfide isomerase/thioredoxin